MRKTVFLLLQVIIYCIPLVSVAENLVPNGSFEKYTSCPKKLGQISRTEGWTSANGGSPDFFHACYNKGIDGVGVPNNVFGTYPPYNGDGYVGILTGQWEHEFIQIELAAPLVKDRNYCVRFWASSPAALSHDLAAVSFLFTANLLTITEPGPLPDSFELHPAPSRSTFPFNKRWTLIYANYTAKGGESVLVIGCGKHREEKIYTFIDEVSVHEYPKSSDCGMEEFSGIVEKDTGNYIPNGSFEYNYGCPQAREELHLVRNWDVGANTPDYYNRCGSENAGVPVNFLGEQNAKTGDAYGGFWVFLTSHPNYREYLQILLRRPLTKGKRYCLSGWFSLADVSEFAVDELHAIITPRRPQLLSRLKAEDSTVLVMKSMGYIENKTDWVFLFADFTAIGNEAYLTIGNFYKDDDPRIHRVDTVKIRSEELRRFEKAAYYYVDDVSITELSYPGCPCKDYVQEPETTSVTAEPVAAVIEPEGWEKGKTLVLRNILFNVDEAVILEPSFAFLDTLAQFMKDHPQMRARISGHTDNTGSASRNMQLSAERAQAIITWLSGQGLEPSRFRAEGRGSNFPVADNATPEGRTLNRRVEISFE